MSIKIDALPDVPPTKYHNYKEMIEKMKMINKRWPKLTKMYKLEEPTCCGRDLWVMQISLDVHKERADLKPMCKYVGGIHGNEAVGKEMLLSFTEYLLERYFSGKDKDIESLINNTDIHILFSMNPDGFEKATLGDCIEHSNESGRKNGRNKDLNRNFPTKDELRNHERMLFEGREPETRSVMRWILDNPFVLSIGFHGGAVVSSYPYDDGMLGRWIVPGTVSKTPDHKLFKHLALVYASNHKDMSERKCQTQERGFTNGITNGAEWYVLKGGMQDFNYLFTNCFEITVELSCCKYPKASDLPIEWNKNVNSLIKFIENVHIGVKGHVLKFDGSPAENAYVVVMGNDKLVKTTERGEFWRLLLPGSYTIFAKTADSKIRSKHTKIHITGSNVLLVALRLLSRTNATESSKKIESTKSQFSTFYNIHSTRTAVTCNGCSFKFTLNIILTIFNNIFIKSVIISKISFIRIFIIE